MKMSIAMTEEGWDDTVLTFFEKELIAAMTIAMGAISDTPEGVQGLKNAQAFTKAEPTFILDVVQSLGKLAHSLLTMFGSGQKTLELSNGWDIDTKKTAALLTEGAQVLAQLQEGKLIV